MKDERGSYDASARICYAETAGTVPSCEGLFRRGAGVGNKGADFGGIFAAGRGFHAGDHVDAPGMQSVDRLGDVSGVSPPAAIRGSCVRRVLEEGLAGVRPVKCEACAA